MQQVLDQLAFDARSTCSIEGALGAARLNARSAREAVSSEMWECLNSTWHALADQRLAARRTGPYAYLELVRRRAALFFGLADSTMSRDDSWRFVVLGRSLERVDMTVRLLSVRVLDAAHAPDWPTLLSASRRRRGVRARVRRFRRHPARGRVPAPGPGLPALGAARADHGRGVPDGARPPPPGPGAAPDRPAAHPSRIPGHARPGRPTPGPARDLQTACMASAEAVAERFFPYQGPVEWAQEGA